MKITNINYKGVVSEAALQTLTFPQHTSPPHQIVIPISGGKIVVFPSGKCRLMGLRQPLSGEEVFPLELVDLRLQSASMVHSLRRGSINLLRLAYALPRRECLFEPELFPALRLLAFRPLCVNVFASGKVVILGLRKLSNQNKLVKQIEKYINGYLPRV